MKNIIFVCVDCLNNKIVRELLNDSAFYYSIYDENNKKVSQHIGIDENKYDSLIKIKENSVFFPNAYAAACSTYMSLFSIFTGKFPSMIRKFDDYKQGFIDLFKNIQYKKIGDYFPERNTYTYVEPQEHYYPINIFSNYYGDYGYQFKHNGDRLYLFTKKVINDIKNIRSRLNKEDGNLIYLHLFALHNDFSQTPFQDRLESINLYFKALFKQFPIEENNYIIFGDHGNAINSQDENKREVFGHINHIVEEVINVPLFFIFKDDFPACELKCNVSLMDILPTILDLHDKQFEINDIDLIYGQSLVDCIRGDKCIKSRYIYTRTLFPAQIYTDVDRSYNSKISIISNNRKLILSSKKNDFTDMICKTDNKIHNFNINFIKMLVNVRRIEKEYYNMIKNVYNEFGEAMWDNSNYNKLDVHNKKVDKLLSIDFNQNDRVLILGCGYNKSNVRISEMVKEVVAVDWQKNVFGYYDQTSIQFIHSKMEDFLNDNIFYTNYFNKILMDMSLHHIVYSVDEINNFNGVKKVLESCRKFLKPSGKIIIGEGILPEVNRMAYDFYAKVFTLKEIRHIFTEGILEELLTDTGFKNIYPIRFICKMSIKNWVTNNILADSVRKYIYNLHLNANQYIKNVYNMEILDDDVIIDSNFVYMMGEK